MASIQKENPKMTPQPSSSTDTISKRKLRVLVISMGGARQEHIQEMFAHPSMVDHFEPPVFSPGINSRDLRNRLRFFELTNEVGLLPRAEYEAIKKDNVNVTKEDSSSRDSEKFFDCLKSVVPITTEDRKGSKADLKLHYSVELWRKAKTINRGRSVLACVLAHLRAIQKFVSEDFDFILEDNVRTNVETCGDHIRGSLESMKEWQMGANNQKCHFLFLGWLGSTTNLKWVLETHSKKRAFHSKSNIDENRSSTIVSFPRKEDLDEDWKEIGEDYIENTTTSTSEKDTEDDDQQPEEDDKKDDVDQTEGGGGGGVTKHKKPGGSFIWGAYAYWISKEGYEQILKTLRNDVGAMLWRGKRTRYYIVKPIDKILPRQVSSSFGPTSVQLATNPTFFRAPMLTSKIHTKWDPEFCKSTEFQLQHGTSDWTDLWLTPIEKQIVEHNKRSGKWLTIAELGMLEEEEENKAR